MEKKGRILIVDDNEDVLLSLNMLLKGNVEAVRVLTNPGRIDEFMDSFKPDVILLDMNFSRDSISGEEGYRWLDFILKKDPKAVVLFITAYVDTEKAVRAIKAGAVDFIPKPWDNDKMISLVESALELRQERINPSPAPQSEADNAIDFIGESPCMVHLKDQIRLVALSDANILITGENGTGKDVVAHLIHSISPRADKPFVTIDLGSVPEQLFESELFGYEKGAFTDARSSKAGRIELADNGTLFLDEIGNLSAQTQQKLLTLIEKREYSRLGGTKTHRVDVRLLAATNADLPQYVAEGRFRQDLLYRLNTIEIAIPPLRQRGNDIILLAEHFAKTYAKRYNRPVPALSADAKEKLLNHSWPGNVRELQHVIERAIVLGGGTSLTAENITFPVAPTDSRSKTLNLETLEREAIMSALEISNGNLSQAANMLGISRFALYRKIEKFGL